VLSAAEIVRAEKEIIDDELVENEEFHEL